MKQPYFVCAICGAKFTSKAHNALYCSDRCRLKGKYLKRREWEQKSGYAEKQREKMRLLRDNLTEEERQQAEKDAAREAKAKKARETRRANKILHELIARAEAGDALAKLTLAAKEGNTSLEYWEAFKEYCLQEEETIKKNLDISVNGISIHDSNFALSVTITIQELRKISIRSSSL